jgi:hypothetical protein
MKPMRTVIVLLAFSGVAWADNGVKIDALLCKKIVDDKPVEPTTRYTRDAAMLYLYWRTPDGRKDMAVRQAWIAEDVGKAAPPNTKIDEKTVVMPAPRNGGWTGNATLSRPTNGWPIGRYRVEVYFGDKLVKSLRFSIE